MTKKGTSLKHELPPIPPPPVCLSISLSVSLPLSVSLLLWPDSIKLWQKWLIWDLGKGLVTCMGCRCVCPNYIPTFWVYRAALQTRHQLGVAQNKVWWIDSQSISFVFVCEFLTPRSLISRFACSHPHTHTWTHTDTQGHGCKDTVLLYCLAHETVLTL